MDDRTGIMRCDLDGGHANNNANEHSDRYSDKYADSYPDGHSDSHADDNTNKHSLGKGGATLTRQVREATNAETIDL